MIETRLRTATPSAALVQLAAPWVAAVAVALLVALIASGRAETLLGEKPALLLLGVAVGGGFLVVFSYLGPLAVLVWAVAATGGYLIQVPRDHVVLTFDRAWIGGLLAYIALSPRRPRRSTTTRLLLFSLLLLVISFGVRSAATDSSVDGPLRIWIDAILLPAILFVACERYVLAGFDRGRRLAASLMIAGGILGAIGIAERIWGFELATLTGGSVRFDANLDVTRISGPYPAPEPYALSLAICLAATLYWILSRPPRSSYMWGVALAGIQVGAIALALFRAGWIAAVLIIITTFGLRPGRFGRTLAVAGIIGALAFAASLQLQENKTVAARVNNTDNIYARLATYKQGLAIFEGQPVFGIGVNRYHAVAERRRPELVGGTPSATWPHSSFVGLLAEQGLVGFIPLVIVLYAASRLLAGLRRLSFRSREATLLLATMTGAVLAYLIMSLTLTMLPYEPSNTFFAAFLGLAAGRLDALAQDARSAAAEGDAA